MIPAEYSTAGMAKGSPEWKERKAAYKRWYSAQPENASKRAATRAAYRASQAGRERERETVRAWHEAHRGRPRREDLIKKAARRLAHKAALKGATVELVSRETVWDRDGGTCGICGQIVGDPNDWDLDHIVPLSRGGAHRYSNVQVSHPTCNRRKYNHDPRDPGSGYAHLLKDGAAHG